MLQPWHDFQDISGWNPNNEWLMFMIVILDTPLLILFIKHSSKISVTYENSNIDYKQDKE